MVNILSYIMAKSSIKRSDKKEGKSRGMNSMNPDRDTSALKGVAKPRSAGTIKRLQMYKNFKAKRTKNGAVIKAAPYQGYVDSGTRARVQPARGWFSNTKVITQSALQKFQVRKIPTRNSSCYFFVLQKYCIILFSSGVYGSCV